MTLTGTEGSGVIATTTMIGTVTVGGRRKIVDHPDKDFSTRNSQREVDPFEVRVA